jgi:hypothetical protein
LERYKAEKDGVKVVHNLENLNGDEDEVGSATWAKYSVGWKASTASRFPITWPNETIGRKPTSTISNSRAYETCDPASKPGPPSNFQVWNPISFFRE